MRYLKETAIACLAFLIIQGNSWSDTTGYELPDITKKQIKAAEEYISKGNYYADKKAYRKALDQFSKASEISSLLFNPRYNKARMLYQLDNINSAINELNSLNGDFKSNIAGFTFLGQIMVEQNKEKEGRQLFEKAVQNGEAILKKALIPQAKIDIALAYHNLGSMYLKAGDLKSAETNLVNSIKANDSNYFSHYALGALLIKTGRFNEARDELQKARDLNKDLTAIDIEMAKAYLFSNPPNTMRAISALREAIRKSPNNPEVYKLLGDCYIIRGRTNDELRANDYKDAIASYRDALNLDKENLEYKTMLARACALAGEFDAALKIVEELGKTENALSDENIRELHIVKAHISREKKEWANAAAEYAKAFEMNQKDAASCLEAGICYYEANDFDNAKKYLSLSIEPFKENTPEDIKPRIEKARKMLLEIEGGK